MERNCNELRSLFCFVLLGFNVLNGGTAKDPTIILFCAYSLRLEEQGCNGHLHLPSDVGIQSCVSVTLKRDQTKATLSAPAVASPASWAWGLERSWSRASGAVFPAHFRPLPPGAQAGVWGQ